ncbi:hypothetical protein WA026_015332 [Henosepilachna vigintioctopunctata]|uniref:Gustatory receptor n=1 Tax=Henosepilachna vigintioctopunctata TaxID=420089 RepID=A0AAW1UFE6_9CUCU
MPDPISNTSGHKTNFGHSGLCNNPQNSKSYSPAAQYPSKKGAIVFNSEVNLATQEYVLAVSSIVESKNVRHKLYNCWDITRKLRDMKKLAISHDEVCNLVNDYNSLFGLNILASISSTILMLLFSITGHIMIDIERKSKMFHMAQGFITILLNVVLPILLAHECATVVAEGKKLITTSLSYLNILSMKYKTYEDELILKFLSILCHQAEMRVPQFTAGGFFKIDYTMLGMIIGCLTTNMMMILQFAQNDRNMSCKLEN